MFAPLAQLARLASLAQLAQLAQLALMSSNGSAQAGARHYPTDLALTHFEHQGEDAESSRS
jgi:hypothetical protein